MLIRRIKGWHVEAGKKQGFVGLPIRIESVDCPVQGPDTTQLVTAWEPTPDELKRLNAGGSVEVRIHAPAHPPILVSVGEV